MNHNDIPGGTIAVVSKCPSPGKSKTRLIPMLGKEGSAALAKAMLSDTVLTLHHSSYLRSTQKILLYAPGNEDGLRQMEEILQGIMVETSRDPSRWKPGTWLLMPLQSFGEGLQSSDLGGMLKDALNRMRGVLCRTFKSDESGPIAFLGMDSPILPLYDIVCGLSIEKENVVLCPAADGGYGMMTVPSSADSEKTFTAVHWSHPLTAVSQLKALTDQGVVCRIGKLMHDIDEMEDVERLVQQLKTDPSLDDGGAPKPTPNTAQVMVLESFIGGRLPEEIFHITGHLEMIPLRPLHSI